MAAKSDGSVFHRVDDALAYHLPGLFHNVLSFSQA